MLHKRLSALRGREGLLRIVSNSAWLFSDRIVRAAVGVVVGVYVARYLGPESFGVLSYVYAYLLIFTSVAALGLDGVVVRDLVKEEAALQEVLGTAFLLRICAAIAAVFLANSLIHFVEFDYPGLWILVAVASTAMIFGALDVVDMRFQSQLNGRAIVTARTSSFLTISALKVVLVAVGAPLVLFVAAPAMEAAISAALLVYLFRKNNPAALKWMCSKQRAVRMLKEALPIACSALFVVGIFQIDKLMLGSMEGGGAVGIYSAAALLSSAFYMVPLVIGASVAPSFVRLYEANSPDYSKRIQDVFSALSAVAVGASLIIMIVAKSLVDWLFGSPYSDAASILTIHVWTGLFVSHVSIRSRVLLIEGKSILVALFSGLTLLCCVLLNSVLIPPYGAKGAAIASLVAWALCALLFPMFNSRTRRFCAMFGWSLLPARWWQVLKG